jgi:ferredoxin
MQKKQSFSHICIYFFSGTGNARFAAEEIAQYAEQDGYTVQVQNMADTHAPDQNSTAQNLTGFIYPTHGFNAPPLVIQFIKKFPRGKASVFCINTRAGMKLSQIHTPGIGGIALWLPALILFLKGYKLHSFRPLDMPSNWISLHPGLKNTVVDSITRHCKKTLIRFSKRILTGRKSLNGLWYLPLDMLLIPISILYYYIGRFMIAKTFFANYRCNNCGLCIKNCPVQAIRLLNKRPFWTFTCESYMQCMNACPKRAIETAHAYTFLIWWLIFSVIPYLFIEALISWHLLRPEFYTRHASLVVNLAMIISTFTFAFLAYHLLHQMLRIKILNKMITFTSLSTYRFWRRYRNGKSR